MGQIIDGRREGGFLGEDGERRNFFGVGGDAVDWELSVVLSGGSGFIVVLNVSTRLSGGAGEPKEGQIVSMSEASQKRIGLTKRGFQFSPILTSLPCRTS